MCIPFYLEIHLVMIYTNCEDTDQPGKPRTAFTVLFVLRFYGLNPMGSCPTVPPSPVGLYCSLGHNFFLFLDLQESLPYDFSSAGKIKFAFQFLFFILCPHP